MGLVVPIIIPMLTAAVLLLVMRPQAQRWIAFVGACALLASAVSLSFEVQAGGIQVLQSGSWPAPFGITLVADALTAILVLAVGVVGVAVTAYAFAGVDPRRESAGYHPLFMVLLMGVAGAFLTGDLFNLYVWFEVMLVASFVLMALHRTREQVRAAFIYVTLNLIASALLLTALGLLYGQAGTLNMADLSRRWSAHGPPPLALPMALLFLTAFGIKAALFPWFFWLPVSYHTPPAAVSAVFAGLLTKVGVYSMIRVFTLLFQELPRAVFTLILVLSAATMLIGVISALAQRDYRRVLSFNLVGHIGYTTMGLGLLTPFALAGSLLYVIHHIVAITNLYLIGGVFLRVRRTTDLDRLGSFYRIYPGTALLASIPLFALAGVPPLSGFIAKLAIVQAAFAAGVYWAGAVALVVSLLSLLSIARVWNEAFWKPSPLDPEPAGPLWQQLLPIGGLSALTVMLSVAASPLLELTSQAARDLLKPEAYVRAVLGEGSSHVVR
jgi:multicomponent Na+:H+ antiporter subunit D